MRILLAQNAPYLLGRGGGEKSNQLLMEALAARGHAVRVAARTSTFGIDAHAELLHELKRRGVRYHAEARSPGVQFVLNGVDVHVLTKSSLLRSSLSHQIAAFSPDVILTSTDDPAQLLLDIALRSATAHVVYLIRAVIATPFGPASASASAAKAEVLRQVDGVVGVSEYVADYARRHGGLSAVHVPISMLDSGETPCLGRFENPFVSMVNASGPKGISIFLALAREMPQLRFAAVPSWATTTSDLAALRALSNVTLLPPYEHPDELFRQTRVTLVPSLWAEARSRVILESMVRGVPVMVSDAGGSREAALGAGIVLPVNPVERYGALRDGLMVPQAEIPDQDVTPWRVELQGLTSDPEYYAQCSGAVRRAALAYSGALNVEPLERYLQEIVAAPRRPRAHARPAESALSGDRHRLLVRRLKQNAAVVRGTGSDGPMD